MIQRGWAEARNEGYQESTGEHVDINMISKEAKTTRDLTIEKGSGLNRNDAMLKQIDAISGTAQLNLATKLEQAR